MDEEVSGFPAIRLGLTCAILLVVLGVLPLVWLLAEGYHLPIDGSEAIAILRQQSQLAGVYVTCYLAASLAIYLLAGFMTARDTGTVKPGMFAAAVAFMASDLVSLLTNLVIIKQAEDSALSAYGYLIEQARGAFAIGYTVNTCCSLIVGAVVAAVIGAVGALIGCAIYGRAS